MHETINIKYVEAKQARAIYHFKNTKRKLYRTKAAIWYNKTCKLKRLTPDYINIKINGKNLRCQKTISSTALHVSDDTLIHHGGVGTTPPLQRTVANAFRPVPDFVITVLMPLNDG